MPGCPDENQLTSLMEGQLSDEEVSEIEQHVDGCRTCQAVMSDLAAVLHPGAAEEPAAAGRQTIGRYEVRDELGTGATGVLYRAFDPELSREVAVKLLRPDLDAEDQLPAARARLLREARLLGTLSHPNVVTVYDVGAEGDDVFVAVELIEGRTFADWQRDERPSWQQVVEVYAQAGRGLSAAHQAGLVHRDVKPDNLMLGHDGRARVTDFGLAKATGGVKQIIRQASGGEPTPLTPSGAVVGTLAYMAPEQYVGQKADARADQFGFCVSLGEALVGERPGPGLTVEELKKIARRRRRPDLPDRLIEVVARGLRPKPQDRFADMAELLAGLGGLMTPAGAQSSAPAQAQSATPAQAQSTAPAQTQSSAPAQAQSSAPAQAQSAAPAQQEQSLADHVAAEDDGGRRLQSGGSPSVWVYAVLVVLLLALAALLLR